VSYSATVIELLLNRLLSWMMGITLVTIVVRRAKSTDASAERRVALVVGNSNYKVANISLPSPRNDAQDMSRSDDPRLRVVTAMLRSATWILRCSAFARLAVDADAALFFYAGHAMVPGPLSVRQYRLEDEISAVIRRLAWKSWLRLTAPAAPHDLTLSATPLADRQPLVGPLAAVPTIRRPYRR
jgi:hypothetical protein